MSPQRRRRNSNKKRLFNAWAQNYLQPFNDGEIVEMNGLPKLEEKVSQSDLTISAKSKSLLRSIRQFRLLFSNKPFFMSNIPPIPCSCSVSSRGPSSKHVTALVLPANKYWTNLLSLSIRMFHRIHLLRELI